MVVFRGQAVQKQVTVVELPLGEVVVDHRPKRRHSQRHQHHDRPDKSPTSFNQVGFNQGGFNRGGFVVAAWVLF